MSSVAYPRSSAKSKKSDTGKRKKHRSWPAISSDSNSLFKDKQVNSSTKGTGAPLQLSTAASQVLKATKFGRKTNIGKSAPKWRTKMVKTKIEDDKRAITRNIMLISQVRANGFTMVKEEYFDSDAEFLTRIDGKSHAELRDINRDLQRKLSSLL